MQEEIKLYIDEYIRPRVQSDGGEISFVSLIDNVVTVKLQGECSRCTISKSCFSDWLENELKTKFGKDIKLKHIIKKPYFWDI